MQQNGLSKQQLENLKFIERTCNGILKDTMVTPMTKRDCEYMIEAVSEIIGKTDNIDPVFKEFLDDPENETVGVFDLKVGKLFKKLIEKVIRLEQTIKELKSK